MQNATCSFLDPFFVGRDMCLFCCFFFNVNFCLIISSEKTKMPLSRFLTSDPPKAWEEMQEEGLEANAVGESQSQGVGATGNLVQRVWTRPGDLWLYVGCLCEMWSPRKGTCVYGGWVFGIVGVWDCGISFLLSQVFVICFFGSMKMFVSLSSFGLSC